MSGDFIFGTKVRVQGRRKIANQTLSAGGGNGKHSFGKTNDFQ